MLRSWRLPLPGLVTGRPFCLLLAAIHFWLGCGHLGALARGALAWTHVWKGFGAVLGAYVFVALALGRRR